MKKRFTLMVLVGATTLLVVGALLVINMDEDFVPSRDDGFTPEIGGTHSVMRPTFATISTWTDAVVVGTVTEKTSAWERCCEKGAERMASIRLQETITFRVESTYKGSAPDTVTIKAYRPGGLILSSGDEMLEPMDFQVGQEYVLFLIAREGYYRVQGYFRGMWAVDGDVATQLVTDETLTLAKMREKVSK